MDMIAWGYMRIGRYTHFGLAALVLCACAPTVWDRPGTTQAEFHRDNARCRLFAEGAVPDPNTGTISTGNFKQDLAANAAVGVLAGMAQGIAVQHKYDLCMQANGYTPHVAGAQPSPLPQQAAASPAPVDMSPPMAQPSTQATTHVQSVPVSAFDGEYWGEMTLTEVRGECSQSKPGSIRAV